MGDPGVAKSQLLGYIDRLAPRSEYPHAFMFMRYVVLAESFALFSTDNRFAASVSI